MLKYCVKNEAKTKLKSKNRHGRGFALEDELMKYRIACEACGIALWDMEIVAEDPLNPANYFTWSREFRRMLGYTDENDFPNILESWSEKLHPEDKEKTFEAVFSHLDDYTGRTPYNVEFRLMLKNGQYRYFNAFSNTLRDSKGKPLRMIGAMRDIDDIKRMTDIIRRRDNLLQASNRAADVLLNADVDSFDSALRQAMRVIGRAVKADRMFIWKNQSIDGEVYSTKEYEWCENKELPVSDMYIINYNKTLPEIAEILKSGKCVNALVKDMPENARDILTPQKVLSVMMVPIFVKEEHWGFITLDNCGEPRMFSKEEEDIVKSGGLFFANALLRNEMMLMKDDSLKAFKNILNSMDAGIYATIPETGELLFVNTYLEKAFNIKAEEVEGKYCYKVFRNNRERKCGFCPCYELDKNPEKTLIWEEYLPDIRGGRHVRHSDRYIDWPDGRKVHMQNVVDITEIVNSKESAEYQQKSLQTILEMLPVGIRIMRLSDGALVYANQASLDVFDCDSFEEQVRGHNGFEFMPETQPDGRKTVELVGELMAKDDACVEMQCLKRGGKPFTARITSRNMDYQGSLCSIAVVEDVTAQKVYRDKIENIASLEREASRAKSDFLANMSHEMRTPLNTIAGMTEIGIRETDINGKDYVLNKISSASSYLIGMINDILDMAKIEADMLEITPVSYNFEKMLENILTVTHISSEEKNQTLTVNTDKKIPKFVVGDDQRLSQIIINLLSNASKFTQKGGNITLTVSLKSESGRNCALQIEVEDDGIGISPENQRKLFKSFEQGEKTTSRKYGGTGLGLAISKRIVEMMVGRIWVESEPGKGAKFTFTTNVTRDTSFADRELGEKTGNQTSSDGIFRGKRLLLGEDIEINREILIMLLQNTGITIECAGTGKEVLDMVGASPDKYDIVFMDLQMPEMSGLEATRRIRELPELKNKKRLPIVAMTANVFKNDIEACLEAGMDDHLGKPIDIEKIIYMLRKYLLPEE